MTYRPTQALEVRRALADAPGLSHEEIAEELDITVEQVREIIADITKFQQSGRDVAGRRLGRRSLAG